MKKQNIPPYDELIERYCNSIQLRNPERMIGEDFVKKMHAGWKGKEKELWSRVKELEINEHKVNLMLQKIDKRVVQFCTGVDFLGFPTYTTHIVKFENLTKDPKRYKKKGSTFSQKLISKTQLEHKEGLNFITAFKFTKQKPELN